MNPFSAAYTTEKTYFSLVGEVLNGNKQSLITLIQKHQALIYQHIK